MQDHGWVGGDNAIRLVVMVGRVDAECLCRIAPRASVGDDSLSWMVNDSVHGGAFRMVGGAADRWRMPEARDGVNPIGRDALAGAFRVSALTWARLLSAIEQHERSKKAPR